jgi:AcrR family transcriptional regulator
MSRPYHHGALRDALLDETQIVLAERGLDAVSLRELARRLGVSHSAPERHFPNRQALLDALSIRGFVALTEAMRGALAENEVDLKEQFRAAAKVYVNFAIDNSALLDLMFGAKDHQTGEATAAAEELFSLTAELVGESTADAAADAVGSLRFVVVATLQGIANLVAAGRISSQEVNDVIDRAASVFAPAINDRVRPR